MIAAAMSFDVDFEDVAVGGAGDFHKRLAATGTTSLVGGQSAVFVLGRQMIVVASAMPLAATLLSARAFGALVGRDLGIGLMGGSGFGFASVETAFQFADFRLEG